MKFLNKFFNFVIAFAVVTYGMFFYLNKNKFFKQELKPVQQTDLSSVDVDKVVNKYLQQTSKKMILDQYKSKQALEKALQEPVKLHTVKEVLPADIPLEQQIHKKNEIDYGSAPVLNSKINQQQLQGLDKKEYARQFIENARKGGYHIELSDDLEVISVTPIRKPSQEIDSVEVLPSN